MPTPKITGVKNAHSKNVFLGGGEVTARKLNYGGMGRLKFDMGKVWPCNSITGGGANKFKVHPPP